VKVATLPQLLSGFLDPHPAKASAKVINAAEMMAPKAIAFTANVFKWACLLVFVFIVYCVL
jgi:hypothetical protein